MVTIRNKRILIDIECENPDQYIYDMKEALLTVMQERDFEFAPTQKIHDTNCTILELLKHMVFVSHDN